MSHSTRPRRLTALAATVPLLLVGLAAGLGQGSADATQPSARAATASTSARSSSLKVSPSVYVAGQRLTFSGTMPNRGVQKIRLQFNMGNAGNGWTDVERGRVGSTTRTGAFRFTFPAPAMLNVSWRVASAKGYSPAKVMQARWQEVTLTVAGGTDTATAGSTFTVVADTAPDVFQGPLPIEGRTVALQKRVGTDGWRTIGTAQAGAAGLARFAVVAPGKPGTAVYRAVERNWTKNGDKIGWFASYPHYVDVVKTSASSSSDESAATSQRSTTTTTTSESTTTTAASRTTSASTPTASTTYGWAPALFDFAWESGESLSSGPARGTRLTGGWKDTSDGTGRASHHNGGIEIDTGWDNRDGYGSHGTTTLTLAKNSQTYGRWEFRMRSEVEEAGPGQHTILMQLVPASAGTGCSATSITVAKVTASGTTLTVGASSAKAGTSWTWTKKGVKRGVTPHNFAVEVARNHITWFYEGRPIATTKNTKAIPGVPLTPRMSMVGKGQRKTSETQAIYDWVRGFTMDHGSQVRRGHGLSAKSLGSTC
ncbi:hypothetical protein [Nocardioides sp. GY 10127]|uniref:hypothetical protein n=1 Tax=Nocardioides sp. GY 10127 TaxID=2569762 RepID=UPI0010A8229C|nr:hypothetical protein [Nocardioides sp. GY 10127]TIC85531.1 hypothetical protein E8D37_02555 [Nocardioides sp. GY 10127]